MTDQGHNSGTERPDDQALQEATVEQWADDRTRFVAEDTAARSHGRTDYPGDSTVPADGPDTPSVLGSVFAKLSAALFTPAASDEGDKVGVQATLARIVDAGTLVVPGADLVSMTLLRGPDQGYSTPVHSDPLALQLDSAQYDYNEGPCVTAVEHGSMGSSGSNDLATDTTWTRFGPAATALGVSSVFSVGLFPVGDPPLRGALNFYRRHTGGFTSTDRETALLLASHASTALAYVIATEAAELQEQQFKTALASRDVIGQAKGILMERRGCSAGEAFDILRRASQDLNVKLHEVASTLAERHTDL